MFRRHKGCRHIGCLNCRQPIQNGNVCWCDQLPCHTVQGSYASTGVIRQLISYYMVTIQSIWWICVRIESSCTSYDIGWLSKVLDESLEQSKHSILLSRYPFCNGSTYHCSRADVRQEMLLGSHYLCHNCGYYQCDSGCGSWVFTGIHPLVLHDVCNSDQATTLYTDCIWNMEHCSYRLVCNLKVIYKVTLQHWCCNRGDLCCCPGDGTSNLNWISI